MTFLRITILAFLLLPSACMASCVKEAQVAARFMNQYLAYTQAVMDKRSQQDAVTWLGSNRLAAPGFVRAYAALEAEGRKADPELGWGVDLIFDAQDSPDQGFKFFQCSGTPGVVLLQGLDWPDFKVAVRVAPAGQGLKVVGAGRVNIPANLRASR
jgi:hypothetical protein